MAQPYIKTDIFDSPIEFVEAPVQPRADRSRIPDLKGRLAAAAVSVAAAAFVVILGSSEASLAVGHTTEAEIIHGPALSGAQRLRPQYGHLDLVSDDSLFSVAPGQRISGRQRVGRGVRQFSPGPFNDATTE